MSINPLDPTAEELATIMAEKWNVELLAMFVEAGDWSPEALAAARSELEKRNIHNVNQASTCETVSLTHGEVYKWKKGVCLQALQEVGLVFPGVLVAGSELLGSVIEVSDPKTEIDFVNNRIGEGLESVNIRLKANGFLRLNKDTVTIITFDSLSPSIFRILST